MSGIEAVEYLSRLYMSILRNHNEPDEVPVIMRKYSFCEETK